MTFIAVLWVATLAAPAPDWSSPPCPHEALWCCFPHFSHSTKGNWSIRMFFIYSIYSLCCLDQSTWWGIWQFMFVFYSILNNRSLSRRIHAGVFWHTFFRSVSRWSAGLVARWQLVCCRAAKRWTPAGHVMSSSFALVLWQMAASAWHTSAHHRSHTILTNYTSLTPVKSIFSLAGIWVGLRGFSPFYDQKTVVSVVKFLLQREPIVIYYIHTAVLLILCDS